MKLMIDRYWRRLVFLREDKRDIEIDTRAKMFSQIWRKKNELFCLFPYFTSLAVVQMTILSLVDSCWKITTKISRETRITSWKQLFLKGRLHWTTFRVVTQPTFCLYRFYRLQIISNRLCRNASNVSSGFGFDGLQICAYLCFHGLHISRELREGNVALCQTWSDKHPFHRCSPWTDDQKVCHVS